MEPYLLAKETVGIVLSIINTATDGALEKAGADFLDFLKAKLQGRFNLKQAKEKREAVEAEIFSEVCLNQSFREELEKLVTQYQKLQKTTYNVSQNTESGVNLNVTHNSGQVIGQQKFFR